MVNQGSFGYKIGRKIRLMSVEDDADLLWQVCVREIYVLIKHYGSIELLREKFEKLKDAKNKPKPAAIQACELFTDLNAPSESLDDWTCLTRYCQLSFINILESGYFLNNGFDSGLVLILDFNTNSVTFYNKKFTSLNMKKTEYETATIEEIMNFDDMPTKTLQEIRENMRERYTRYKSQLEKANTEIQRIDNIINKARELGGDRNIIDKALKLKEDLNWEKRQLNMGYRFFYNRLDALNLIDHMSK